MGADPIVVATSVISAQQGKPMHGFLVRKAEKTHGTGQRIEGFREKPARVVIVDDVCTTGASTIQAIEAAREYGFEIAGVLCLVEREEAGGRANVEKAAAPAPFVALFTANDVRAEHVKRPYARIDQPRTSRECSRIFIDGTRIPAVAVAGNYGPCS